MLVPWQLRRGHLRVSFFCSLASFSRDNFSRQWFLLLQTCISTKNLRLGQSAHARILTSGLGCNTFLANNLVNVYTKCNSPIFARQLFDQIPDPDIITYNSILASYAQFPLETDTQEAFSVLRRLLSHAVKPTPFTLAPVLKLCLNSHGSSYPECIHCLGLKMGLVSDLFVSGPLLNIYSNEGKILNARYLFDEIPDKDLVTWNLMIRGYKEMGAENEILLMFTRLNKTGLRPDEVTMNLVLAGCSQDTVDRVKAFAVKSCLLYDDFDVSNWNKTMTKYLREGDNNKVVQCFAEMNNFRMKCDCVTLVVVLSGVANGACFDVGRQIHSLIVKLSFDLDISVTNNLINMYSRTGYLDYARRVFYEMEELDLVSWNTMICSCVQRGFEDEAVALFLDLYNNAVVPDHFTLASILCACGSVLNGSILGKQVHVLVLKSGNLMDSCILTSLIDCYAKIGSMEEAECLFDIHNRDVFDLGAWNALIAGYVASDSFVKALNLFSLIQKQRERSDHFTLATSIKACSCLVAIEQGKQIHAHSVKLGLDSDLFVSSALLDMYLKSGSSRDACIIFASIYEPDEVVWTAMISGSVEMGDEENALQLYYQMRSLGLHPDEFTFSALVKACSCLAALEQGKQIQANAIKLDHVSDDFVGTSLIDMYARCGCIEDSHTLFRRMGERNITSWNAMIVGFAKHGNGEEGLNLFRDMISLDIKPDAVTFIGVLHACSHSGLVSESQRYFQLMQDDYGLVPQVEHYACLVDVLARAGLVAEAEELIQRMPFEGSASMYNALLGACRIKGDLETGERVADRVLQMEPTDSSVYVQLSNIYAGARHWDKVERARLMMRERNVRKDPGYSWIQTKNKVHIFLVDDKSHPEADAIYKKIDDLMRRIKLEGYVPDTGFVLHDLEEEEKQRALCYHSEKLAVAYGLLSTPHSSRIRVMKNLRVCGDCHNAIKYISKVSGREIVLRDTNRFHCFSNGKCSCGDFW